MEERAELERLQLAGCEVQALANCVGGGGQTVQRSRLTCARFQGPFHHPHDAPVGDVEALDHEMKHVGEHADLGSGRDPGAGRQVAFHHAASQSRKLGHGAGDQLGQQDATDQRDPGADEERHEKAPSEIGEGDQVRIRAMVHIQHRHGFALSVHDRGEARDPGAALVGVDRRDSRLPLRQYPSQAGLDLRRQSILFAHGFLAPAGDGEPPAFARERRQRIHRLFELVRLLNPLELSTECSVGRCVVPALRHDRLVLVPVEQQCAGPRDVEQEATDHPLEVLLQLPVLQISGQQDAERREGQKRHGQAGRQPPPEGQALARDDHRCRCFHLRRSADHPPPVPRRRAGRTSPRSSRRPHAAAPSEWAA